MSTPQGQTEKMVSRGGNLFDLQLWAICYGYFPCLLDRFPAHSRCTYLIRPKAGRELTFCFRENNDAAFTMYYYNSISFGHSYIIIILTDSNAVTPPCIVGRRNSL